MSIDNRTSNSEFEARRDVAKGAGTVFLAKTGSVIEIITQPAYTWMFGLATYGLYSVLWSLVNLLENIADLAMTAALQRVLPKMEEAEARAAVIKAAFILGVLPCLVLAFLISINADQLAPLFNVADKDLAQLETGITLFIWALPLWASLEIATSALRACQAFGPEIRLRLLWEQLSRFVLAVLLWSFGVDTLALLIAHLMSLILTTFLSLRLLHKYCDLKLAWRCNISYSIYRDLFLSGLSVLPANVLSRMFVDMPAIVLNFSLPGAAGANASGLYSIARKLASIPQLVRSVFSHVVSPVGAASVNREQRAAQALYTFSIRLSLLLALPTAMALIMAADTMLALFVTGAAAAWPVVVILTTARGFEAAFGPASALQQVISHRGLPILNSAIGFLVAMIVLLITFSDYQTVGMAFAVASGQLVIAFMSVWQLAKTEGLKPFDGSFKRLVIGASLACLLIFLTGLTMNSAPALVKALAITLSYLLALWLSVRFALPVKDRDALGKLGRRLKLSS
ncbi:MAG: oligosaccharide flippase family protein [Gammaproteobacteria bacterium]|nr:oligosaccharide flippase family protein [Gammaproteobacteria bacterium]